MMSQTEDDLIVVLDTGSSRIRELVADTHEGALRYRGHGELDSVGMRKGLIADLGPAAKQVRAVNERTESVANANIDECIIGVGGPHIRGLNSNGGVELSHRMREISKEDVRYAIDRARAIELPADREILHLLPRQYVLDDQPGVYDPIGMIGQRLEVDLHIVTCSGSALQSAITCANRAGVEVVDAVLESIAAAEATLTADERDLGVCLLNIGAHSTDLVVYYEGAVAYTASVAIGGAHFTNDLAIGLQLPVADAEELKRQFGHCVVTAVPQHAEVETADPEPRKLRLRTLAEILEPRARELMHYVRESLRQGGVFEAMGSGCVLTGGGAMLPGLLDVAESQLRVPVRVGVPVRLSGMPAELVTPAYSTVIGLLLYAHRTSVNRAAESNSLRERLRAIFAASF